jgi:hypothetical protein
LQSAFPRQFKQLFPDRLAPKSVVVIPSLTLDQEILGKIDGHVHYEERLLCLLLLLRMPCTHLVYLTSMPVDPVIIDYYLHLLPGITRYHALGRLTMLSCYDTSPRSLTEKILERPRLLARIRDSIPPGYQAHLACFNVTPMERTLAVSLGMPVYGCDPDIFSNGNKSNGRKLFREVGLDVPPGTEDLRSVSEIVRALVELRTADPSLKRAVLKLNEGFSGEGNAIFRFEGIGTSDVLSESIREQILTRLRPVANGLTCQGFLEKFHDMGGIVEAFLEGERVASPSVQCRIDPLGEVNVISTHDQEMGGESDQVYLGAYFPADSAYAAGLGVSGLKVAEALRQRGVIGRFGVDFMLVRSAEGWKQYAIEINLRKGGTTHPFISLQYLTDGTYDHRRGIYQTANGQPRYYYSTDNLVSRRYVGITPPDLIDIAMVHGLHYDGTSQEGVMFHLIGALSQFGKLGVVCIGNTRERARFYYDRIRQVLDAACSGSVLV